MKMTFNLAMQKNFIEFFSNTEGGIHLVSNEDMGIHTYLHFDIEKSEPVFTYVSFTGSENNIIPISELPFLQSYLEAVLKKHSKEIIEKLENDFPEEKEFDDEFDSINGHRTVEREK